MVSCLSRVNGTPAPPLASTQPSGTIRLSVARGIFSQRGFTNFSLGTTSWGRSTQAEDNILSNLGMDIIIFSRGSTPQTDRSEFYWRALEGAKVLTILMPDGYNTGAELSEDPDITTARLDQYIENFH